jgi:hydrogenase maturation protease
VVEGGPGARGAPPWSAQPDTPPPNARRSGARGLRQTAIIGVGNALRGDDAVGLEVVRLLRARAQRAGIAVYEHEGEPTGLLDLWEDFGAVVLVDAVRTGAAPGTIHRADASSAPLPTDLCGPSSTHALGIGEAVELARTLRRLPARVVLFGVEGLRFDAGAGLSEEVQAAVAPVADAVLRDGERCA